MPLAEVPNLIPVVPELFLVVAAMGLLMFGVFQRADDQALSVKVSGQAGLMSICILAITAVLVFVMTSQPTVAFGGLFIADPFAVFFKTLILISVAMALYMSQDYLARHGIARFEYAVLVLFATVGMMMMVSAGNLMSLYLGLELQSLALYVIASFQRDDQRSTEAGLKYFVLGALASGMLLYGMSLIYGFAGTTDFATIAGLFEHGEDGGMHDVPVGLVFGIVFLLCGLAFKISAVPFHMWTPDVYEGAPTPVTALFATAPKIAAIALFLRVMVDPFGSLVDQWQQIIVFISVASMALGAFAAIAQTNIKRLMAYSSIGHMGYALIGLAVANETGVTGVMIYMGIYIFMNLGAFACILAMTRDGRQVEEINDLAGLSKTHPLMAAALACFMFSMAGIPPLAGFFGKFYIFLAAIESELYGLAVIGVLTSVVGCFYYIRIIKVMYFDEATAPLDRRLNREVSVILAISTVVIMAFFLVPDVLIEPAQSAAQSLFAGTSH